MLFMKQQTNSKQSIWTVAVPPGLAAISGVVSGEATWWVAGLLGLAALAILAGRPEPKLAPVRVRPSKQRR